MLQSGVTSGGIVDALGRAEIFASLDREALTELATEVVVRRFRRGEYLFHTGDHGDSLMVLARGLVKVTISSADGAVVVLSTVRAPGSLGELAVLDGAPRSASVIAAEPTTVLMIRRRALLAAMAAHPPIMDAVLTGLGQLVRRLTETTGDLVFLDLGGRLAKSLLRLAGSGRVVELALTQSDIAAMVGASRPAVNKALQAMAGRGWISLDGPTILLHDVAALRHRAGLSEI